MRKIYSVFLLFIVVFFSLAQLVRAQKTVSTPSPLPQTVDSYELFWPLVAGKTIGEPFYFLKVIKENVRGMLIFGKEQKADYDLFLATKRILEVEKLLNDNKTDSALKTLDAFLNKLKSGKQVWAEAKQEGSIASPADSNVQKQATNINLFLKGLSPKYTGEVKSKIDQGISELDQF